jgi:hypothetical protein
MFLASSVIRKSGQWWKVAIASWAVILGAGLVAYQLTQLSGTSPESPPIFAWVGSALALIGFLIACIAVRCQNCGVPWIWLGMTQQSAGSWMNSLAQSECPRCHK